MIIPTEEKSFQTLLASRSDTDPLRLPAVGGNSAEREPSFSARTGAHSCSVVVRDGPLPAGAEFDALMYTFTGVTPLFAATRSGKGSLSALAVEYQGAPLQADVDVTAAAAALPAELEPHGESLGRNPCRFSRINLAATVAYQSF